MVLEVQEIRQLQICRKGDGPVRKEQDQPPEQPTPIPIMTSIKAMADPQIRDTTHNSLKVRAQLTQAPKGELALKQDHDPMPITDTMQMTN